MYDTLDDDTYIIITPYNMNLYTWKENIETIKHIYHSYSFLLSHVTEALFQVNEDMWSIAIIDGVFLDHT